MHLVAHVLFQYRHAAGTVLEIQPENIVLSFKCGIPKRIESAYNLIPRNHSIKEQALRKTGGQTVAGHVKRAGHAGKSGPQIRHPIQSPKTVHLIRVVTYHVYGSQPYHLRASSRNVLEDNSVYMVATQPGWGDGHCPVIRRPNITRIGSKKRVTAVFFPNHPVGIVVEANYPVIILGELHFPILSSGEIKYPRVAFIIGRIKYDPHAFRLVMIGNLGPVEYYPHRGKVRMIVT